MHAPLSAQIKQEKPMSTSQKGIAVVTGASSGIGAIYADRLARRGYDLILIARNKSRLDEVAMRIIGSTGRAVNVIAADLNNRADLIRIEALLAADPGITMLVNNAGVGALAPLLQSDVDAMEEMIELNVTALTRLTYAMVPAFVARGGGTIINISSAVAIAPEILNGVYGGTKAFVLAFSLSLHKELVDKQVRIQAVLPGATATNFWDAAGGSVGQLPEQMVMRSDDLVDAALAGFDQGELITIPSLQDSADWNAFEVARQKLVPNLSLSMLPARYRGAEAA
jgi:short-subunit dehydrogenase